MALFYLVQTLNPNASEGEHVQAQFLTAAQISALHMDETSDNFRVYDCNTKFGTVNPLHYDAENRSYVGEGGGEQFDIYDTTLQAGDICTYELGESRCTVRIEVLKLASCPERPCAVIRVLDVTNDATGNGFLNFLKETGDTMNASLKYLRRLSAKEK